MYPIAFATAGGQYVPLTFTDSIWLRFISEENKVCFLILKELFRNHKASNDFSKELANENVTISMWDNQFEALKPSVTKDQVRKYFRHLIDKELIVSDYDKRDDSLQISITGKGIISAVSNQFLAEGKIKFVDKWKSYSQTILALCGIVGFFITTWLSLSDKAQKYKASKNIQELEQRLQLQENNNKQVQITLPQIEKSVISLETYIDSLKKKDSR